MRAGLKFGEYPELTLKRIALNFFFFFWLFGILVRKNLMTVTFKINYNDNNEGGKNKNQDEEMEWM